MCSPARTGAGAVDAADAGTGEQDASVLRFDLPGAHAPVAVVRACDWANGGLGFRVWGAAQQLAAAVARGADAGGVELAGRRVCELGAGLGLPGLAAAALPAPPSVVVLTDALPALLASLAAGAALQGAPCAAQRCWDWRTASGARISVRRLLWEEDAGQPEARGSLLAATMRRVAREATAAGADAAPTLEVDAQFDVILGADVLYDEAQAQARRHSSWQRARESTGPLPASHVKRPRARSRWRARCSGGWRDRAWRGWR